MAFDKLKSINLEREQQASTEVDKTNSELANLRTQEVFVKSIQSLVKFIEGHTTKSVVMNQLKDYATSDDMESLGKFLRDILEETKKHENTDVTPVVEALNEAVTELKAIPKEQLDISFPEQKDYSEAFKQLLQATKDNLEATKAQKLIAEAPVVNVDAPIVNVDAPDLKPFSEDLKKSFKESIKSIVFPEYKVDLSKLEKEAKEQTKLLKDIRDTPGGGGSSGSGSIAPFLQNGALPVSDVTLATRLDNSATPILYVGKAVVGSATSSAVWQISKLDTSSGLIKTWADGNADFDNVWDDILTITYS